MQFVNHLPYRRLLVIIALISSFALPVMAQDVILTVTPDSIGLEESATITAEGLAPNQTYTLDLLLSETEAIVFSTERTSNSSGQLTLNIRSEASDIPGEYIVRLLDGSELVAETTFMLEGEGDAPVAPPPTTNSSRPTVNITVLPNDAPIGNTHNILVSGLEADEAVMVRITFNETNEVKYNRRWVADASGRLQIEIFTQEDSDLPGMYTVSILEMGSDEAIASASLNLQEFVGRDGVLTVSPATDTQDETYIINASELKPFADVSVSVINDVTRDEIFFSRNRVDVDGLLVVEFTVAEDTESGTYVVRINEGDVEVATGEFVIAGGMSMPETDSSDDTSSEDATSDTSVTITPDVGSLGDVHEVSITGLNPNSVFMFEIIFEGTGDTVYSVERGADPDGNFVTNIATNMTDPTGDYRIEIVQRGEVVASAMLNITDGDSADASMSGDVSVMITPESGAIPTEYTVTISGLVADDVVDVDVMFDGASVFATTATADADGNAVIVLFSEDSDPQGEYMIVASMNGEELASGMFVIGELSSADADDADTGDDAEEPAVEVEPFDGTITVDPASGERGSIHVVTVEGLNANETVTFQVILGEAVLFETERTADADGMFSINIESEARDSFGVYQVAILREGVIVGDNTLTVTRGARPDVVTPDAQPDDADSADIPAIEIPTVSGTNEIIIDDLNSDFMEREYTFEGNEGDIVYITLNSDDFDSILVLQDDAGFELNFDDDSGGSLNSAIGPYTLPYTGEYTVIATSYDGYYGYDDPTFGMFELTIQNTAVATIDLNSPSMLSFDENSSVAFLSFEGNVGDVISVTVDSNDGVDTKLRLLDPFSFEMASDDDSGAGYDPELIRIVLDNSGEYLLVVETFTAGAVGDVVITVENEGSRTLDDGAQMVTLNGKVSSDVITFTGEADTVVTLDVSVESGLARDVFINVTQNGEFLMTYNSAVVPDDMMFSVYIPSDGDVSINIEAFGSSDVTFELSTEVVE